MLLPWQSHQQALRAGTTSTPAVQSFASPPLLSTCLNNQVQGMSRTDRPALNQQDVLLMACPGYCRPGVCQGGAAKLPYQLQPASGHSAANPLPGVGQRPASTERHCQPHPGHHRAMCIWCALILSIMTCLMSFWPLVNSLLTYSISCTASHVCPHLNSIANRGTAWQEHPIITSSNTAQFVNTCQ